MTSPVPQSVQQLAILLERALERIDRLERGAALTDLRAGRIAERVSELEETATARRDEREARLT